MNIKINSVLLEKCKKIFDIEDKTGKMRAEYHTNYKSCHKCGDEVPVDLICKSGLCPQCCETESHKQTKKESIK